MPASKTLKHKEENKHRFLTFSERLSRVSINAVRRIERTDREDEDSKFQASLVKWRDQDRSLPFREFYGEIGNKAQNFKMIVHYRNDIVKSLQKHLSTPHSLALESLCELLVALCMDLRSEFYPFFEETFLILTKLLNAKELDRLELVFNAVSLLFKYLWKYMIVDMDNIFTLYYDLICGNHASHIATFAAESLTFLIRKASNQNDLYKRLLKIFQNSEVGIGKIIFFVLKGTKGMLYSRTNEIFPKVLACLIEPDMSNKVFNSVDSALNLIANHVDKDNADILWKILLENMESYNNEFIFVTKLLNTWCSFNCGQLILSPQDITNSIQNLCVNLTEDAYESFLDLSVTLVTASKSFFPSLLKENIVRAIITSGKFSCKILVQFWKSILNFVNMNINSRQLLLKFCQVHIKDEKDIVICLLTQYVLSNCEQPTDAEGVVNFSPFRIDYALVSRDKDTEKIQNILANVIKDGEAKEPLLWATLLLMQHIRPVCTGITEQLYMLFNQLAKKEDDNCIAVIRMLFQCLVVLNEPLPPFDTDYIASLIIAHAQNHNALFIIDIILTSQPKVIKKLEAYPKVLKNLMSNLSHHDAIIRKFSLRILSLLYPAEEMFQNCLLTEQTPATVSTCRMKSIHLGKIKFSPEMNEETSCAILRFLVSNLFINFSTYWPHVQQAIASFMPSEKEHFLWKLLFELLTNASSKDTILGGNLKEDKCAINSATENADLLSLFVEKGLTISYLAEANLKPDFINFRLLFWKTLTQVSHIEILEQNNRHIVTLFFEFLENEYYKVDKSYAPFQDITVNSKSKSNMSFGVNKRQASQMLTACLQVLGNFNNPVSCISSQKLKSTFESLLMHGDADIQRSALKCLLRYRDKKLLIFKDQLISLLDDDKIRDTMVHFNLSDVVEDKRESLIPVLFRLMYGRMVSKSGIGGQGRKRRSTVLRYLSGLTQQEMQAFIFLSIESIKHYVDQDISLKKFPDTTKIVPLSRQRGILTTLSELIEKHPNQLSDYMFDYLLDLSLSCHFSYHLLISTAESDTNSMDQQYLPFIRILLKQSHLIANSLIESWPEPRGFTSAQISKIFSVLVNPHIQKLQHECIAQPNSLLHLFNIFAMQPKFLPLLGQKIGSSEITAPIEAIITALVSEKMSPPVSKFIMEMLIRLIDNDMVDTDFENSDESRLISETIASMTSDFIVVETMPHDVGLKLLVNYVIDIIKYFTAKLKEKKTNNAMLQSHLKLMIALGPHIEDCELAYELGELLLNHVSSVAKLTGKISNTDDKCILPALTTINMIPVHSKFLPVIAKLFSRLVSRECRLILVEVFQKACNAADEKPKDTLNKRAAIVSKMNAWDKRFIEELDYDSRLISFQELNEWLESDSAIELLGDDYIALTAIVHNCIFTLMMHSKDLSLRESSSRALELVINLVFEVLSNKNYPNLYHIVIGSVLLPSIRKGLNCDDENQRHEWLRLLVRIVKLSSNESNSAFSCLKVLINESDPDGDFFVNVQHIQFHRRTRAFKKLAQIIDDEMGLISHTIASVYLMPLAIQTLKCQDLSNHLYLRDACLGVIQSCAKISPWSSYIKLLQQVMAAVMRNQHGVKILCSVLNGFHFDIGGISDAEAIKLESLYAISKCKENYKTGDETGDVEIDKEKAMIYSIVACDILPKLCESISGKNDPDAMHKLADSSNFSEIDKCNIRAPLAVAVVSLLRKLPNRILHVHLPMVVLKIVGFLRHHYIEVRTVASKILVQIAELLPPHHLAIIFRELKSGLTRGYQKHVLTHTISCILTKIEDTLKVGSLDSVIGILLSVLNDDLFGKIEEERSVDKIQSKTPEARGRSKAYNLYRIMAKFVQKKSLPHLISPLKNILDATHDHKKRKNVESILLEISQGIQENSGLTADDIMIFLHGILTENMPGISTSSSNRKEEEQKRSKKGFRPESCYLLSSEPERYGVKQTKKTKKTNLHLIIEFSLRLLNSSIKRQVISLVNPEQLKMVDPFVNILKHCLESQHSKTVTEAVRCFARLIKTTLPSMLENAIDIIKSLFKILRENSQGSVNHELASATYKTLSVLCASDLGEKLTDTQLQVLLAYAEEMLYERDRQAHAFNLIQSILNRGLRCNEVIEVLHKVRDICIQTHDNAAMVHARQVYMFYIGHYPLTKTKLINNLEFVLAQLSFDFESGRLSALELLASIINLYFKTMIKYNPGIVFIPVSIMLVNDESVKCRKLAAHILKLLLTKLEVEERDQLFSLLVQWFNDSEHRLHQQLAAMLVTIFAEVENMEFKRHLPELMPLILHIFDECVEDAEQKDNTSDDVSNEDHFLFHLLSAFHSILRLCKLTLEQTWNEKVSLMLQKVETVLLHPHMWVRIIATQILGTVFSSWDPETLATSSSDIKCCSYLTADVTTKLKTLSIIFSQQIQSPVLDPNLTDQCIKNLLFIIRVQYIIVKNKKTLVGMADSVDDTQNRKNPIHHLFLQLSKTAKLEAANNIKETSKRTAILKFFAAATMLLESIQEYLHIVLNPVYRECERRIVEEDKNATALKTLANEVLEVVKSKVGSAVFTKAYAKVQKRVTSDRRERKRKRDVELVANPQKAAAAKVRRQIKKKDQRKRKIASIRPEYGAAKKRRGKLPA
uniref:small subunit processome component 20 homolog n=1 Tax=Styela clava TaxID=7725 RepID=UPI001939F43E|nr:small subunit processome component 20 homolog [Styela clava]